MTSPITANGSSVVDVVVVVEAANVPAEVEEVVVSGLSVLSTVVEVGPVVVSGVVGSLWIYEIVFMKFITENICCGWIYIKMCLCFIYVYICDFVCICLIC